MGTRQPYTATYAVHFDRAGRARNLACTLSIEVDPSRQDPDDVMPALHRKIGRWLIAQAPGMTGQDLELLQEHCDPPSGYAQLNAGRSGSGTWAQTSTTPITPTQETT